MLPLSLSLTHLTLSLSLQELSSYKKWNDYNPLRYSSCQNMSRKNLFVYLVPVFFSGPIFVTTCCFEVLTHYFILCVFINQQKYTQTNAVSSKKSLLSILA